MAGSDPLAGIALATGFADQAHMTRSIAGITGLAPARWRKQGQIRSRPA
jgi:transcriptional regulator GlxA family with amidase domain